MQVSWRAGGLVVVAVAAVAATLSHSPHAAHAAETGARPQISASAAPRSTIVDRARERAGQLGAVSDAIAADQLRLRLAAHDTSERVKADSIRAEIVRLRSLDRFAWPTAGGVSSGFGMRKHPILGYVRLHNGADIGGACGNPVVATQSGTVTKAGYSSSSGNNVRVNHGRINGPVVETAYLHMSRLAVRVGQRIAKGQVIGYVGTTGLSTACHLHLALYKNGSGSDPRDCLNNGGTGLV